MKIATIVGARPQFVKAAVLSRILKTYKSIQEILIHTGQHYDPIMSQVFFDEMEIPEPVYNLGVQASLHGEMTGEMLRKLEQVFLTEKPDLVLVYGDTNSTLAGALAASKLHIPLAHVEAGLRSYNMKMPEEINRLLTDKLSDFLFVPSKMAVHNLHKEGIADGVFEVGDIMFDALLHYKHKAQKPKSFSVPKDFILLTLHRQESFDAIDLLKEFFNYLNELNTSRPIVFPCHPGTLKRMKAAGIEIPSFAVEPVGYFEMLYLLQHCSLVITDSGGLQKEAFYMHKFCITLRDTTEWKELVDLKANKVTGLSMDKAKKAIEEFGSINFSSNNSPYGDGQAATKIMHCLLGYFKI